MSVITPPFIEAFEPNVFNFNPASLVKWRKALANVQAGLSNARILYIGNSVVLGVGSGTSNTTLTSGEVKSKSAPSRLATLLNQKINAHANSFCGSGGPFSASVWPTVFGSSDTRLSVGSSWTPHTTTTLGGAYIKASTTTNALSFTPTVNVDTFDIYVAVSTAGGFGVIQADINGGTAVQLNTAAGGSVVTVQKFTVTGSLGSNTCNIKYVSGTTVYVVAVVGYDSSKKWIDVMNAGWSGGVWVGIPNAIMSNPGAVVALTGIAPDLTILQGGINDWVAGNSVASYKTSLQTMITTAQAVGSDVILTTDNPTNPSLVPTATQQSFVSATYALASSNNIPLIDLWQRWNSYTIANAAGFVFNDNAANNYHPNTLGYTDIARAVANMLLRY